MQVYFFKAQNTIFNDIHMFKLVLQAIRIRRYETTLSYVRFKNLFNGHCKTVPRFMYITNQQIDLTIFVPYLCPGIFGWLTTINECIIKC